MRNEASPDHASDEYGNMRFALALTILVLDVSLVVFCQANENCLRGKQQVIEQCRANPDPLYDREKVLGQLAVVLNASASGFRKYEAEGFNVAHERPQHFFVFDLTDPSNKSTPSSGCINFLNNHIYHFAARYIPFSLSHVALLEDGRLKVFKAINCESSKDNLDELVRYVEKRLNLNDKDEVIKRLKDYRKYGEYFTVDDLVIRCGQLDVTAP